MCEGGLIVHSVRGGVVSEGEFMDKQEACEKTIYV